MNTELAREVLFRLDELTRRVTALERHLAPPHPDPASSLNTAPLPLRDRDPHTFVDDSPKPPPIPTHESTTTATAAPPTPVAPVSQATAPLTSSFPPAPANDRPRTNSAYPRANPRKPRTLADLRRSADLERSIGARWYAGAGALIVVIGIGLFIKLAFDRGWFHVAPAVRCIMGALFGGGLIVLGEFIRKRLAPLAAAGIYAAGLGSIFVSTYAAYRMYALLEPPLTFTLLALVGVFGVAIAIRAKLPIVAILSLVAGFLTPFLFLDSPPRPLVLPAYTLTLLAIGLCVTAWKGSAFAALRRVAWWGTSITGTIWLLGSGSSNPLIALAFLALVWAFVHAELAFSAVKDRLNLPASFGLKAKVADAYRSWRPLLTSFSTSAWALSFAIHTLNSTATLPTWFAPAALLAAAALLACALAGFPRPFLETPTNDRERLAACLVLESAAALIATIAIAFSGLFAVFAWMLLALAVLVGARWLHARGFYAFSLVSLVIATVRLVVYDSTFGGLASNPYSLHGLNLSIWTLCMLLAAGLWFTAARFIADEPAYATRKKTPPLLAGVACALLLGSVVLGSEPHSVMYAWLAFTVIFMFAHHIEQRFALFTHAFLAACVSILALFTALPPWNWNEHASSLHPGLIGGLAITAAFALLGTLARRTPPRLVLSRVAFAGGAILLFAVTSLDVARIAERVSNDPAAQRSALSIWWSLYAIALIAVGFWRRLSTPRRVGLALLGIAALKAVLIDLHDVPATWRVASFLGIGLLMLAVGVVYSKVSSLVDRAEGDSQPPSDTPPPVATAESQSTGAAEPPA